MGSASTFEYASLKELLSKSNAEVLLPSDGAKYEKSIERWGEQCIKRAVSLHSHFIQCVFRTSAIQMYVTKHQPAGDIVPGLCSSLIFRPEVLD
jgi:hypothetical protein